MPCTDPGPGRITQQSRQTQYMTIDKARRLLALLDLEAIEENLYLSLIHI